MRKTFCLFAVSTISFLYYSVFATCPSLLPEYVISTHTSGSGQWPKVGAKKLKRKFVSFTASQGISGSGKYTDEVYSEDGLENYATVMLDDGKGDEIILMSGSQWDK